MWASGCGDEIPTGVDAGGGPYARAWCCASGSEMVGWYAYAQGFGGGVRVAAGNDPLNLNMITAAGPGGGPHVRVWTCCTPTEVMGFYAYSTGWTGGVFVASGNVDGTGNWEIITGVDAGGGPHVRIFRCCSTPTEVAGWYAWSY